MDSPKPPLQQLVYQGSPGKILLLNKNSEGSHSSSPQCTSENCDPNLEKANLPGVASALARKNDTTAAAASILDNHNELTGIDHVNFIEPREGASAGGEDCDQRTSKDKDHTTPKQCGGKVGVGQQLLKSPTTAAHVTSPGGGHGHGHRQHFCRSPRCASNNPDYASPAQVPPRKYLISKRHLIPGAICTRDPSTLPSSQIPLPPSSSTGKPPARPATSSACKLPHTNTFRQLSFKDASSDTSKSVAAGKEAISSPVGADCVGPAAAGENNIVGPSPDELAPFTNKERNASKAASETQLQEQQQEDGIHQNDPVNCDCSPADVGLRGASSQDLEQSRSDDSDGGCIPELNSVGYEITNDVEGEPTGPAGFAAEVQIHGSVDSVEAEGYETPDFSAQAGESSDSSATAIPLPPFRSTSEEEPVPAVASCGLTDRQVCDEVLSSGEPVQELADDLPLDVADVTETLEQGLALEAMDETISPSGQPSCDEGVVDIYDLAAAASTYESEEGAVDIEQDYILQDCPTQEGREAENCECLDGEVSIAPTSGDFEGKTSQGCRADEDFSVVESVIENPDVLRESETTSCKSTQEPEAQRAPARFGRSKGRQLWRNDCRDSREVVTLKPTEYSRQGGDWMVDSLLEGAVNRLKPSGEGRVRLLVEAFESLMNIKEPEPEKRPSRLWCFNRMGKGEVDDDGDECEEGDQRVDCYEVSGDKLELRASMRLSLGGGSRLDVCAADDDEEVSPRQKVQDWDDQAAGSSDKKDLDSGDQEGNNGTSSTKQGGRTARRHSEVHTKTNDRKRVQMYNEVKLQLGYKTEDNVKMKIQRYNRPKCSSKSSSVKSDTESNLGSAEKSARALRHTNSEPFRLLTEERGALKEYQFAKKLEQLFAEEERLRNPIAQGLPWTTDEPEVVPKPPVKQPTRHVDFSHYSNSRATIRAEFDQYMAEREMYIKIQKEEEERRRQIAEQEEIKRLRREMVPRAQLMPFFDQPFMPSRSSKRLTVPKEPNFKSRDHKRAKCMVFQHGAS